MRPLTFGLLAVVLCAAIPVAAQARPEPPPKRPKLAAGRDTNNAVDYLQHGLAKLSRNPTEAVAAFYWAGALDPTSADALFGRYVALLLELPFDRINDYLTRYNSVRNQPQIRALDSIAHLAMLRNPWVSRRPEGAVLQTWLEVVMRGDVNRWEIERVNPALAAWMNYNEGRHRQAAEWYAKALARTPDDPELHLLRAHPFVAIGQIDSALAAARSALLALRRFEAEDSPIGFIGYPFVEYSIGVLFEGIGQLDSARAAYERALLDDVAFQPAHRRLGRLRLVAGDTTGALAEFEQAAVLAPGDPAALYDFGLLSLAARRTDSVVTIFERASAASPHFAAPHLALARLYDGSGFVDEAMAEYRTFVRLAPRTMAAQVAVVQERLRVLAEP